MDAEEPAIPRRVMARVLLALAVGVYIGLWSQWTMHRHEAFGTFGFDFGIFDQGMWLLSRFESPFITVMGAHLFGDHTSFILLPLVPFYWLTGSADVLNVSQSVGLGLAAVPLFFIGRRVLRDEWVALLVALTLLVSPAVHWINWEQFHPDAFEVPLLLLAVWLGLQRRWRWYAVAVLALLACKEDAPFLVLGLGAWLAFKVDRRAGLWTISGAIAYFGLALFWWLPMWNGVGTLDATRIPYGGWGGTIRAALTKPWDVIGRALGEDKPFYLWQLALSSGLTPLLGLETAAIAVLPLAVNLLINWWYSYHLEYHYTAPIVPALALATVYGLTNAPIALRRWIAGAGLVIAAASGWYWGPSQFARHEQPLGEPNSAQAQAVRAMLREVPDDASVSSFYAWVPHLSHRKYVYEFPVPWHTQNWQETVDGLELPEAARVRYLMLYLPVLNDRDKAILERLEAGQFTRIARSGEMVLLKRTAPAPHVD